MFKWLGFEAGTEKGNNSASTIKHDVTTNDLTQDNHSTTGEEGSREPQGPPSSADVNDSDKQSEGQQSTAGSVSGALGKCERTLFQRNFTSQSFYSSVNEKLLMSRIFHDVVKCEVTLMEFGLFFYPMICLRTDAF